MGPDVETNALTLNTEGDVDFDNKATKKEGLKQPTAKAFSESTQWRSRSDSLVGRIELQIFRACTRKHLRATAVK